MDISELEMYLDGIVGTQCASADLLASLIEYIAGNNLPLDADRSAVLTSLLGAKDAERLLRGFEAGGWRGFREEGRRLAQDEGFEMRTRAVDRLKKLTSMSVRGSLGEKLALIRGTGRLLDNVVDNAELLTVAFAYTLIDLAPKAAARAEKITDLVVKEASSREAQSYLEEACYCYFYGLNTACAITCRSILEEVIERKLPTRVLENWRQEQSQPEAQPTLGVLLVLSKNTARKAGWHLPPSAYKPASTVLEVGNRAAHNEPIVEADAFRCMTAAREAIAAILGDKR